VPEFSPKCPIPVADYPRVLLAHGGGGSLMHGLIDRLFAAAFDGLGLQRRADAATLTPGAGRLAFTTDSFVVAPLFFPGGDIGSLAVHGTVNDLATAGARPIAISASYIIEEGLPMEDLWRIATSMAQAARRCGVQIVTGDTKVVERGKGDGLFLNTAGVGLIPDGAGWQNEPMAEGDAVLVSGDLGRHGMAVMAAREGLGFDSTIDSDSAPIHEPVLAMSDAGVAVRCVRDVTRGGLATVLNELAATAGVTIELDERALQVRGDVRGACELLGLDPLYVACEGRFAAVVAAGDAGLALEVCRAHPVADGAGIAGTVTAQGPAPLVLRSVAGTRRIVHLLSGEQLPRIC
jgi:hydrogenase expression/formation protein HypE